MAPVDLSASIYAQYKRARKRAAEAERRGAASEAAAAYHHAAGFMRQYAGSARDAKVRQQRNQRADALDALAQRLQNLPADAALVGGRDRFQPAESTGEDDYEGQVLSLIQSTDVKWDDIGGLDDTKQAIKAAYGLALARKPVGVEIASWRNFLLFGPPGTGKTLLAAATAGNLDATFFNVKVSDLLSKYFGESTKLISALYAVAARLSPAVIFIDEFESLTPPRGSGESGAERRIVSTLLAELDGLKGKGSDDLVITIGATNVPWLIDSAMLSRFQKRIYVPLPDEEARQAILEIFIIKRGHKTQITLPELVRRTAGYAGREIEQICQTAVTHMTQRANPGLMAVVDRGQDALRAYEIRVEPLSAEDFQSAFESIQPLTDAAEVRRYADWLKQIES
jgi:katanin p60 ATPase-containing subunit A1